MGTRRIVESALVGVALSSAACGGSAPAQGARVSTGGETPRRQGSGRDAPTAPPRSEAAFQRAVTRFCRAETACLGGDASDVRACVDDYDGEFASLGEAYGAPCVDAYVRYLTCLATAYERRCDAGDADALCADAIVAIESACRPTGPRRRPNGNR